MTRTFVLNINLHVIEGDNALHLCTDRAFRALEVLREFDRDLKTRRHLSDDMLDDVLIVQLQTADITNLYIRVRELADELQQEAIAMYEGYRPGYPPGVLIGKNVQAWGPFRLNQMRFIDPNFRFTHA